MRFIAVRLTVFALVTLNAWAPGLRSAPRPMTAPGERRDIQAALAGAIRAALRAHVQPGKGVLSEPEQADLERLYGLEDTPVWCDRSGHLRRDALAALAVLARAGEDGLDPGDYGSARLERLSQALTPASPSFIDDLAAFDVGLSSGLLRYFRHLHLGRLDPRAIGFRLAAPPEPHDFVGALREGLADHRLEAAAAALRPALAQYQALRNALAEYRALARAPAVEEPLPDSPGVLKPGDMYGGLAVLQRRLAASGDLPPDQPVATGAAPYTGAVVEGVRRFQARHGLRPDGIVGVQTRAALRVPLGWRVRQIELALERLRWLPDLGARRLIALNIPMFQLWAWDSLSPSAAPSLGMRAIVGRALRTQTPVFAAALRDVIFRPSWTVPRSIVRNEILPALERAPDYLGRHDMEIVRSDGAAISETPENIALLKRGVLRLRQRPGPQNALGLVKFEFPNSADVYVHGTPAQELFSRTRRDFSHGCVRAEDTLALAEWVLREEEGWNRERILRAMAATTTRRVRLAHTIDVVLFYTTAAVAGRDGTVRFAEDIYRHDETLHRLLTAADAQASSDSQTRR